MARNCIIQPVVEPLTLAEVKLNLRQDDSADDSIIAGLIAAAREQVEHRTGRALITQTWEHTWDSFPVTINLSPTQIQSVLSVKYIDADGNQQTLPADQYQVDSDSAPGRIMPAYGLSWPGCKNVPNAVRVQYTCGYGDTSAEVPAAIKHWMQIMIATWYAQKEFLVDGRMAAPSHDFMNGLLDRYTVAF